MDPFHLLRLQLILKTHVSTLIRLIWNNQVAVCISWLDVLRLISAARLNWVGGSLLTRLTDWNDSIDSIRIISTKLRLLFFFYISQLVVRSSLRWLTQIWFESIDSLWFQKIILMSHGNLMVSELDYCWTVSGEERGVSGAAALPAPSLSGMAPAIRRRRRRRRRGRSVDWCSRLDSVSSVRSRALKLQYSLLINWIDLTQANLSVDLIQLIWAEALIAQIQIAN